MNTDLDKTLINILGKDAYYSTDFKVADNVTVLVKTVSYLFTQLSLIQRDMTEQSDKEYVNGVKQKAIEILNG